MPFSRLKSDWLPCAWSRLKDNGHIYSTKWTKIHGPGKVFEVRRIKVTHHFECAHAHWENSASDKKPCVLQKS